MQQSLFLDTIHLQRLFIESSAGISRNTSARQLIEHLMSGYCRSAGLRDWLVDRAIATAFVTTTQPPIKDRERQRLVRPRGRGLEFSFSRPIHSSSTLRRIRRDGGARKLSA